MLFLLSGEIQNRQREEDDPRTNQERNTHDWRNRRVPNLKRHAQHRAELLQRFRGRLPEARLERVLHNHLPKQQRAMRRREELDDHLHPLRQLADRNVDAHHEADDRADDRARNRERVVALEERNEEQHQRRVRER